MTDMDDVGDEVSPEYAYTKLSTKIKRGTGTRDQDTVKVTTRHPDPDAAAINHQRAVDAVRTAADAAPADATYALDVTWNGRAQSAVDPDPSDFSGYTANDVGLWRARIPGVPKRAKRMVQPPRPHEKAERGFVPAQQRPRIGGEFQEMIHRLRGGFGFAFIGKRPDQTAREFGVSTRPVEVDPVR